ncbi:MAG: hypothetical protein E7191_04500 [Erysipelotrichaceae bacterium]|nr:hypothetical protein [Erysipelotrichaceae bacterium]
MIDILLYFIWYSFLGWVCESVWKTLCSRKLVNSGFLYSPLCPIYGFGGLLIIYSLTPIKKYPLAVFLIGMLLVSILEYLTGLLLEVLFHMKWWDYSNRRFQLHGRVCLENAVIFGCMGLLVIYGIHPRIIYYFEYIPDQLRIVLAMIAIVTLILDTSLSVNSLIKFNQAIDHLHGYLLDRMQEVRNDIVSSREYEELTEKLLRKHQELREKFPKIRHLQFDIKGKVLSDLKIKRIENPLKRNSK